MYLSCFSRCSNQTSEGLRIIRILSLLGFLVGFTGCNGTAAVLKEDTAAFTELIDTSVTATRSFYDELNRQQINFMIEWLAARPSCNAESTLYYSYPKDQCLTSKEVTQWMSCKAQDWDGDACEELREFKPMPFYPPNRQTMVSLLASVGKYQLLLSKILEDETFDSAKDLKDLNSRFNELKNQIKELKGDGAAKQETKGTGLQEQLVAVGGLIDLISKVEQNQKDFVELKKTITSMGPVVDSALEDILEDYEKIYKPQSDRLIRNSLLRSKIAYNQMSTEERMKKSVDERKKILRGIYEAEAMRLSNSAKPDSLAEGLRGLIRSHKTLQKGFKGNLTKEQRARIAKENQKQLEAAFKSMLNIVKLFV